MEIVDNEVNGKNFDNSEGANMYNNPKKENADWVKNVKKIKEIRDHTFYKEENQTWLKSKPVD